MEEFESANDDNDVQRQATKDWKDYLTDDTIMFKESGIKKREVLLMILGFSTRFSLSYKGRKELFHMVKLLAGPKFEEWNFSDCHFLKTFDPPEQVIKYTFYCTKCNIQLADYATKSKFKKCNKICSHCKKNVYFINGFTKLFYIDRFKIPT